MICTLITEDFSHSVQGEKDLLDFNSNICFSNGDFFLQIEGVFTHGFKNLGNEFDYISACRQILDCSLNNLSGLLNGVYRVIVIDKVSKRLRSFSSLDGQLPLFVYTNQNKVIIGTSIKEISEVSRAARVKLNLSLDGSYMLLGHGFMLDNHTLFQEIRRVPAHKCLDIDEIELSVEQYITFNYTEFDDDENVLLEEFNRLFVNAIKKQFSFDQLSSRKHLVALSGGLDSRMVTWVAHQQGYADQVNYTFAQVGSGDESIPKQIAAHLGHDWLFNFLDNGNYLLDHGKSIKQAEGNSVFAGMAHSSKLYQYLDFSQFGVVHSGQLGDVILAWHTDKFTEPSIGQGAYNAKFISKLSTGIIDLSAYQNDMDFKYLNRYINGTNYGLRSVSPWTCSFSPFLDLDVWKFLTQVPLKYKLNHKFYVKWMNAYYPDSTNFVYDAWNLKPNTVNPLAEGKINFQGRAESLSEIALKGSRALGRKLGLKHKPSTKAMNPYEAWWQTNLLLSRSFNEIFDQHIGLLEDYPDLRQDVTSLYQNGRVSEKLQAMDLLLTLNYIGNFK